MRTPTKQSGSDRRGGERRGEAGEATQQGERRVVEQRGMVSSMVDALEDILKWERASERAMRVAEAASADLDVSSN